MMKNDIVTLLGFIVLFVLETVLIPVFLLVEKHGIGKKSLLMKMLCATVFLLNALWGTFRNGGFSSYSVVLFIALIFSWLGDLLLHVSPTDKFFVFGLSSFLIGHLFFSGAYTIATDRLFPGASFIGIPEMVLYIVLFCFGFTMLRKNNADFKKLFIPCTLYTLVIDVMVVKAIWLGVRLVTGGGLVPVIVGISLAAGALCFSVSDFTLSLIRFSPDVKDTEKMRKINIWTYFYAQMLLGLSAVYLSA